MPGAARGDMWPELSFAAAPCVCVLGGGVPALLLLSSETPITSIQLPLSPSAVPRYGSPGRATGLRPQSKRFWDP